LTTWASRSLGQARSTSMNYPFVRTLGLKSSVSLTRCSCRKCINPGNTTDSRPCATSIPRVLLYRPPCLTMFTSTSRKRSCWLPLQVIGAPSFTWTRSEYMCFRRYGHLFVVRRNVLRTSCVQRRDPVPDVGNGRHHIRSRR
jgi:hypothetical protein